MLNKDKRGRREERKRGRRKGEGEREKKVWKEK